MDNEDPLYIRILDKLGVNTTRLRWKLHKKEEQIKQLSKHGVKPARFQWLSYPHKICPKCRAINDRESKNCHSCESKIPSMFMYRIGRIFRSTPSNEGPITIQFFLGLILLFFAIQISIEGFSKEHLMSPSRPGTLLLGAFTNESSALFRWMAFGLLHGNLIHIAFNGYALYNIGPTIESFVGRTRMLVLITVSQLGSALACYLWYIVLNPSPKLLIVIGASGWLFGLIGFGIIHCHRTGMHSVRNQLLFWSGLMLFIGLTMGGNISNCAHIGGMLSGMALALLPEGGNMRKPAIDKFWAYAAASSALLWVFTVLMMGYTLIKFGPEIF